MIEINGRFYPLWSQFVEGKDRWIGGTLEDLGDSMDRAMGEGPHSTEIINIALEPNGKDSATFRVEGKDFSCAFGVKYGGVVGGEEGWLTFNGYGGHTWRIKENGAKK